MRKIRVERGRPAEIRGSAVALGNFDGVHRGHQAVVGRAQAYADAHRIGLAAAVFEPHPRAFFKPDTPPFRLQTSAQRMRALADHEASALYEIGFDAELAALEPEDFVAGILRDVIGAAHVAVGFDFRFGRDRKGDAAMLSALGAQCGIDVAIVDEVDDAGHDGKVSSSSIREALRNGDVAEARRLLGRPWAIEGEVAGGFQRGRTIGFPTANIGLGDYLRPMFGVYATRTNIGDGVWRPGVANIGVKPSVEGAHAPLLEVHLFDFGGDIYGRTIETRLHAFLRPERKFEDFAALKAQIAEDASTARRILAEG